MNEPDSTTPTETAEAAPAPEPWGKRNPFPAKLLHRYDLTAPGSVKSTQHYEFSLEDSGYTYEAGDILAVFPENLPEFVDEIIENLPFKTDGEVESRWGETVSLRQALIDSYDIRALNKKLITQWSERSGHPYLKALVEANDAKALAEFMEGRELIDLVTEYPAAFKDASEFVGVLRKIAPRLYSIASSLKAHPNEVHLTVAVVQYETHGRLRKGVCSNFLNDCVEVGNTCRTFVQISKKFKLPEDGATDIIMVGPGTGIAPFRAFLEERKIDGASGRNWLFFGNPHSKYDYFYKDEFAAMMENGTLHELTIAWSRDQDYKIYVQDKIRENSEEIWKWLDGGAIFYVCGDAEYMAPDVDKALHDLIAEHGGMSEEAAAEYVEQMKKDKRYQRDVY